MTGHLRRLLGAGALVLLGHGAVAADGADAARAPTDFLSPELRRLQADESRHPGFLWIEIGADLWKAAPAPGAKSCRECHGEAKQSMKGVAARYPQVDKTTGALLNLEGRIERCRTAHQAQATFKYESEPLLALTAFVALQSRGMPMDVAVDGAARPYFERGKAFFETRRGQLNLACAQCHVGQVGKKMRGETISSGVGTGYPAYRLEWNALGSLHRRFRSCSFAVRAKRYDLGSPEYTALELYLAWRARGLPIETPGMRP